MARSEFDEDPYPGFVDAVLARDFPLQFVDQRVAGRRHGSGRLTEKILFLQVEYIDDFLEVFGARESLSGLPVPNGLPADAKPFGESFDRPALFGPERREPRAETGGSRLGFVRNGRLRKPLRPGSEKRRAYRSRWNRLEETASEEGSAGPDDFDMMNARSRQLDLDHLPDRKGLISLHEHATGREVVDQDFAGAAINRFSGDIQPQFPPHIATLCLRLPPVLELRLDNHRRCSISGILVTPR